MVVKLLRMNQIHRAINVCNTSIFNHNNLNNFRGISNNVRRDLRSQRRQAVAAYLAGGKSDIKDHEEDTASKFTIDTKDESQKSLVMERKKTVASYLSKGGGDSQSKKENSSAGNSTFNFNRAHREALNRKRQAVASYLSGERRSNNFQYEENRSMSIKKKASEEDDDDQEQWLKQERENLMEEAGFISRSFYRTLLRSVKILRPGNDHDEEDFSKREDDEEDMISFSMIPVDRENELLSRFEYYYSHLREHFLSDSQCLDGNPWKEHDIEIFLHHLRSGEQRRQYILKDYKFDDPHESKFYVDRIKIFEKRAFRFIKRTYKIKGWMLPSEKYNEEEYDKDLDEDFDETEYEDHKRL